MGNDSKNIPTVMYHATDYKNLGSILVNGLNKSIEGGVYLADSSINAIKFTAMRGMEEILVLEVSMNKLDSGLLEEAFDHDENIFGCKAWVYLDSIGAKHVVNYIKFDNPLTKKN